MSGPFARILAQALVVGFNVVSKAFVQAYQQAAANPNAAKEAASKTQSIVRKHMATDEALKVLNLEELPRTSAELTERYLKYFNANDPKKGGSFYLQSKFFRAKEAVEKEMRANGTDMGGVDEPGKQGQEHQQVKDAQAKGK
jgi:import inner membrane translocase subunit TIM16